MRGRFPARRGLIPWLGWSRRARRARPAQHGPRLIDLYVIAPTRRRDEVFHRTISELLQESERLRGEGPAGATVVADERSSRAHRCAPRSQARDPAPDAAGRRRRPARGDARRRPGADRSRPGRADAGARLPDRARPARGRSRRRRRRPGRAERRRLSEGLRTTVLDAGAVGGQAGSSSLIRNYLGFPRGLGGGELAQRAYQQAWLFGAQFRLTHARSRSSRATAGTSSAPTTAPRSRRAVVLALGVEYRRLDAPG